MSFQGIAPILFESVSNVTATLGANSPELGTKITYNGEEYLFVYNSGNSQISKGHGCIVSGLSGYSVTVSAVTQVDCLMGVVKHSTLTTATYGWVLTRGFCDLKAVADSSVAAGNVIVPAADGEFTVPAGTAAAEVVHGKAVEATASAGTFMAYIKCFG